MVLVLLVLFFLPIVQGSCPGFNGSIDLKPGGRNCNGHGTCGQFNRCTCTGGWTGVDCSLRTCPFGTPWTAIATAKDTARLTTTECSNMGTCERSTGICTCRDGFGGSACQKLNCPNDCSGHGICYTMADAAITNGVTYSLWDATSIQGCVCDQGYWGYDCSLRSCPMGHDPALLGRVNEIQAISCICTTCTGTFILTWKGLSSIPIAAAASASAIQAALNLLTSGVSVTLDAGATSICSTTGSTALITFMYDFGQLPPLQVVLPSATLTVSVQSGGAAALYGSQTTTVTTTKVSLECSGRGVCDYSVGHCHCSLFYTSSDGQSNIGSRPDCGFRNTTNAPPTISCPAGVYESDYLASGSTVVCSGKGSCTANHQCQCYQGWGGSDCSLRTCPTGKPWFQVATITNTARTTAVECSTAGICDYDTGMCTCNDLFEGSACERLKCPVSCQIGGKCQTMRELAASSSVVYGSDVNSMVTWDADRICGCTCRNANFIWGNTPSYGGYDCSACMLPSQRLSFNIFDPCPSGDDPWTTNQVNEVQTISCFANGGSFTLSFRGYTTPQIPFNANENTIQTMLENLASIGLVSINMAIGSVCNSQSPASTTISFLSNTGALPLISADTSLLKSATTVAFSVVETTKGTTEYEVCCLRGNCGEYFE
uniref:Secreted protein n=1 Tax=Thraustotheca clavata TaxID=74557 RepID=A0A0A7CMH5_9STRA|nr:secreted protein [Thraustotheca clavata]